MMEINNSLKAILKRLRLSGIVATLPDRIAYSKQKKLTHQNFLELVFQDEIERRENKSLAVRLQEAGFEEEQTLENFDWDAEVTFDRELVRDLFSLGFLGRWEDIIFSGPVGGGKTHLSAALGHSACRAGYKVLMIRADKLLGELRESRADRTHEKAMRRFLAPDLLILDDFGLRRLDAEQSSDLYELIIERHKRSSTIVTSNRAIDEWIALFDDPMLAQSALDRLAHNAYQVVIEGDHSYRGNQRPGTEGAKTRRERRPSTRRRRKAR
jgi:DNA replication protein DnaC